jgi:hypothetical protein
MLVKHSGTGFVATAATIVLASALAAAPALATTAAGWSVKPGGSITGTAAKPTLKDTNTGTVLTCATMKAAGKAKSGSGLSGTKLAEITSVSFTNCSGPLSLTFTVTTAHLPWYLNATSYTASTGVTEGIITGAHATLSGPGCSAVVDGTSATADDGTVAGTYTNSTHTLKTLTTGGDLHVYDVDGCFGLVKSGDAATLSGSAPISPAQTITGP